LPLSPTNIRIPLSQSGTLTLQHPGDEDIVAWTWELHDQDSKAGKKLNFPEWEKRPAGYRGLSWRRAADNQLELIAPDIPTYSQLQLKSQATLKKPSGEEYSEAGTVTINFTAVWGGVAKASYPYPVDWGDAWASDDKGKRALVLMFDLVNQMPEELRRTAGPMPIMRVKSIPFAGGIDAPYFSDCILIAADYLNDVDPKSPTMTPGDLKFESVVMHEIGHCISYQKSSLNVHGALSPVLHTLRSVPTGLTQLWSFELPLLLAALHSLLFYDFMSDYARAAGWWLNNPLVLVLRRLSPIHDIIDFINFLAHIIQQKTNDEPIRPNVITGWWLLGNILGLTNTTAGRDQLAELQTTEFQQWNDYLVAAWAYSDAVAGGLAKPAQDAAQEAQDEKKALWQETRNELDKALAASGFVSSYAATDVLEDIAETILAITFTAKQLNSMRDPARTDLPTPGYAYAVVTEDSTGGATIGFAARRRFLTDQGIFPKDWKGLTAGQFMRGLEDADHLDQWQVEL
jgi:hypothetical protein